MTLVSLHCVEFLILADRLKVAHQLQQDYNLDIVIYIVVQYDSRG